MAIATHTWMSAPTRETDAAFRKWAQGIHDTFIAAGWVQTDDTGQVDLETVEAPGSDNDFRDTMAGYDVFRMDDALHATAPVFVKVEYGSGYSSTNVGMYLTVGKGSDGAGAITDALIERISLHITGGSQGQDTTTEYASYGSGDESSVNIVLWPAWGGNYPLGGFTIERSCSDDGTPTDEALLVVFHGHPGRTSTTASAFPRTVFVIGMDGAQGSVQSAIGTGLPVCLPGSINGLTNPSTITSSTLSKDGVTAPVLPIPLVAPGVTPWVSCGLVVVHPGDAGATSVIQAATVNGHERIYRAFPFAYTDNGGGAVLIRDGGNMMRFYPAIAWAV